ILTFGELAPPACLSRRPAAKQAPNYRDDQENLSPGSHAGLECGRRAADRSTRAACAPRTRRCLELIKHEHEIDTPLSSAADRAYSRSARGMFEVRGRKRSEETK